MGDMKRNRLVTAWPVRDDPDPDNWTVNIQADLAVAAALVFSLQEAATSYANAGKHDAALVAYYMAEDINNTLELIGGRQAAEDSARRRLGRE